MKCVRIFFMVHIFLLLVGLVGLVGFSVESQAGLLRCSECTELYDNKEKSNSDKSISEEAPICKICAEKISRQNISVDGQLSPVYETTDEFKKPHKVALQYENIDLLGGVNLFAEPTNSANPQHQKTYLFECQKKSKKQISRARLTSHDDATCFAQSMCDDESDSSIGNPELWEIVQVEDKRAFTMRLMLHFNAKILNLAPAYIEQVKEATYILAINNNSHLKVLEENLRKIKTHSELYHQYLMASDNDLPDFFATSALADGDGNRENFLLEKKTLETIQFSIERIEKQSNKNYNEFLYLIIKQKDSSEITLYPLIINVDPTDKRALMHFFDTKSNNWYRLPGEKIPDFIKSYTQWGEIHNNSVSIYGVIKPSLFVQRKNYERSGFNNTALTSFIERSNQICRHSIPINDITERGFGYSKNNNHIERLMSLKQKIQEGRVKEIHTTYIEWYKKEWYCSEKSKKSFILKLLGTTTADSNSDIIVTQLDDNTYGFNLLEDTGPYLFIAKQNIKIFAKQLMWVSDAIVVYEIQE